MSQPSSGELSGKADLPEDLPADPFEQYLEQRDRGEVNTLEALQASELSGDLQDRIQLVGALEELAGLLGGETPGELPLLAQLGRFQELKLIGTGGLSRVYSAYDPRLDREVALKVLLPQRFDEAQAQDWMISEGRTLAQIQHPCVVEVFEVDETEDHPYIAMERVDGPTLQEVLEHLRGGPKPMELPPRVEVAQAAQRLTSVASRLRLALDLAEALASCHAKGVIHRDVKPGNVLLPASGKPKLIDFGLAHLEGSEASLGLTQRLVGTAGYVAPEQVDQDRSGSSVHSDQFSLGVILYELVTLQHPFHKESKAATMAAVSRAMPSAPRAVQSSVPGDVERIVMHALERDPGHRYPAIADLADDLRAFLEYRPISLRAPSLLRRAKLWATRNSRAVLVSSLTLLAVIVFLAASLWQSHYRQRAELSKGVASELEAIDTLSTPEQFIDVLKRNSERRSEAARLDRSVFQLGSGRATDAVLELEKSTARKINSVVAPLRAKKFGSFRLDQSYYQNQLLKQWGPVLWLERTTAAEVRVNDDLRNAGQTHFPKGTRLFKHIRHSEIFTRFEEVPVSKYLQPGVYRAYSPLESPDRPLETQPWGEAEFLVGLEEETTHIDPQPLNQRLADRMILVKGRTISTSRTGAGQPEYKVDDFLFLPDMITWEEFCAIMGNNSIARAETSLLQHSQESLSPHAPAIPTVAELAQFTLRTGCRIATPMEYVLADQAGLFGQETGHFITFHQQPDGNPSFLTARLDEARKIESEGKAWDSRSWIGGPYPEAAALNVAGFRLVRSVSPGSPGDL